MNGVTRFAVWTLAVLLVLAPIVGLLNGWFAADRWPLKKLRLSGEFNQVSDQLLRETVMDESGIGFFAVDLDRLRDRVEALPWVARAEVRKQWPDTLIIRVSERKAVAHWGQDRLLSASGELFDAPQAGLPDALPWLEPVLPELQYGSYIGGMPDRDLVFYDIIYPTILDMLQGLLTVEDAMLYMEEDSNASFE